MTFTLAICADEKSYRISKFMNYRYYKIHSRVLLQPICAGEVSVVIDKQYNIKDRKLEMSNYHYFLLLKCNFSQ